MAAYIYTVVVRARIDGFTNSNGKGYILSITVFEVMIWWFGHVFPLPSQKKSFWERKDFDTRRRTEMLNRLLLLRGRVCARTSERIFYANMWLVFVKFVPKRLQRQGHFCQCHESNAVEPKANPRA